MTKEQVHQINVTKNWVGVGCYPMIDNWRNDPVLCDGLPPPPTGMASEDAGEQWIADNHS